MEDKKDEEVEEKKVDPVVLLHLPKRHSSLSLSASFCLNSFEFTWIIY